MQASPVWNLSNEQENMGSKKRGWYGGGMCALSSPTLKPVKQTTLFFHPQRAATNQVPVSQNSIFLPLAKSFPYGIGWNKVFDECGWRQGALKPTLFTLIDLKCRISGQQSNRSSSGESDNCLFSLKTDPVIQENSELYPRHHWTRGYKANTIHWQRWDTCCPDHKSSKISLRPQVSCTKHLHTPRWHQGLISSLPGTLPPQLITSDSLSGISPKFSCCASSALHVLQFLDV